MLCCIASMVKEWRIPSWICSRKSTRIWCLPLTSYPSETECALTKCTRPAVQGPWRQHRALTSWHSSVCSWNPLMVMCPSITDPSSRNWSLHHWCQWKLNVLRGQPFGILEKAYTILVRQVGKPLGYITGELNIQLDPVIDLGSLAYLPGKGWHAWWWI